MKRGGAFVWEANLGSITVGSCWPATRLLKSKNLIIQPSGLGDIEIFPEDDV